MNWTLAAPEILLGCGAMALLMLGGYHTALALGGSPHLASLVTQVTP